MEGSGDTRGLKCDMILLALKRAYNDHKGPVRAEQIAPYYKKLTGEDVSLFAIGNYLSSRDMTRLVGRNGSGYWPKF